MDTATVIFAGITLWFALRGFWLGLPAVLLRLLALAAAYLAAIFLAPGWVGWVDAHTPLDGLAPWPATLLAVFLGTAFLVNAVGNLCIRIAIPEERRRQGKLGAVLLNGAFGAALGLLAVWCLGLLQAAVYPERNPPPASALQAFANQATARVLGQLIAVQAPQQPGRAALAETLLAEPGQTVSDLHYLANHAALNSVLRDPDTQALMHAGDLQGLAASAAFHELASDPRAHTILQHSGFVPAGGDQAAYEAALAERLAGLYGKVAAVRDEPQFQAIVSDPDYRQRLQQGDVLSLLNDERTQALAGIILSAQPGPRTPPAGTPSPDIHRWQDSSGRWHFSDAPPR